MKGIGFYFEFKAKSAISEQYGCEMARAFQKELGESFG